MPPAPTESPQVLPTPLPTDKDNEGFQTAGFWQWVYESKRVVGKEWTVTLEQYEQEERWKAAMMEVEG